MSMPEFLRFTKYLLQESSKIIKQYYRTPLKIESKEDLSPVTIADKKTEELLRNLINQHYPDHGIIGEEFGEQSSESEYQWVLDPIDGTRSFISGTPLFGTLIALLQNKHPIIGGLGLPVLGEILLGDSEKTTLNDIPVKVRPCSELSQAVLVTTDYLNIKKYQDIRPFNTLMEKVSLCRTWGDCFGYYLLATGYTDIMIDPVLSPWDILPIIPIIKGAGGKITDYFGNNPVEGSSLIAANPTMHKKVLSLLHATPE
jgi:myo-inositol-1(or 4)-monophosphatase